MTPKFKIEGNVAIPEKKQGSIKVKRTYPIYPFKDMNIGESFEAGVYSKDLMVKISNAARSWSIKRNNGWRFAVRKMDKKLLIWRIQ